MGRYEDDRARQIERENAEVVHVIETPLRILMELGKWLVVGSLVFILVLVNQVGWIVDLGERSQRGRVEHNNQVEGQIASGGFQSVFDIDFRTQPDVTAKYVENYDRFWDDSTPFGFGVGYGVTNRTVKAFSLRKVGDGWGQPDAGIPYCMAALHVDRRTNFFNDTPGSWWASDDHPLNRNDDALDRKSARMQRDYEVAAMMTAALRSTLAHMKLGRPVSEVRSPLYEDDYLHRAADPGYCDADSAAHDPQYGVAGTRAYRATLLRINLQHAPVVRFRYPVGIAFHLTRRVERRASDLRNKRSLNHQVQRHVRHAIAIRRQLSHHFLQIIPIHLRDILPDRDHLKRIRLGRCRSCCCRRGSRRSNWSRCVRCIRRLAHRHPTAQKEYRTNLACHLVLTANSPTASPHGRSPAYRSCPSPAAASIQAAPAPP